MKPSDLSIVILTKNGGGLFAEVLASLMACDGILDAEVLMIDSGSTDRTLAYARQYSHIRIHEIPSSEFGHGKTRNLGARLTSRPVIIYLVQDATPIAADFLTRLATPLADQSVAAVFGRQRARSWTNKIERMFLEKTYPNRRAVRSYSGKGPMKISDIFFSNVCSAMRREVWERIPFDETLIMSEDQMWAKQALLAGHSILYEPKAEVFHSHNYQLKEVFKRNFDSGVSLVGIAEDTFLSMIGYEFRYLSSCIGQLARKGELASLPSLLAYEATRTTAFAAGQRAHLLSTSVVRALSLHKYHWTVNRASS
jgi:rhamnosyltransferase